MSVLVSGSLRGDIDEAQQAEDPTQPDELRRGQQRAHLLPLPPSHRLRGLRLGLHNRAEEVRRPLLRRRLRPVDPATLSAHAHREHGGAGRRDALLRAPQAQLHLDAVLRPRHERRLRQLAQHGGG